MIWNYIFFIGFILGTMLITHTVIYISGIYFFPITTPFQKHIFQIVLIVCASSFILASLLVRYVPNPVTGFIYNVAGTWYALIFYLLLASIVLWVLKGILVLLPIPVPHVKIVFYAAIVLYSASLAVTVYGVINASSFSTTYIRVPFKNLPKHWAGKTIVHLSDIHVGASCGVSFLKRLVTRVNKYDADLIIITGDLFDGASGKHEKYLPILKGLRSGQGAFFVSGNHEVYAGVDDINNIVSRSGITVTDGKVININGLQIIGIGSPRMANGKTRIFDLKNHPEFRKDLPSILLYHTPTDYGFGAKNPMSSHQRSYLAPRTVFKTAQDAGVSLQLSGHTHAGQFFPFTWIAGKIYHGLHYGLHKFGDFYINISSGTGTWGPPVRIDSKSEIVLIELIEEVKI